MNVITFIQTRNDYWKELESLLIQVRRGGELEQDQFRQLSQYYRATTSDYAYATTFYPHHDITPYLNKLVSEAHGLIYQRKRFRLGDAWQWFTFKVPSLFKQNIGCFLLALLTFTLFFWVGFIGSETIDEGEKMFLAFSITNPEAGMEAADGYIKRTELNIKRGDPFGVYEDDAQATMFSGIMFNNIQVAIFAFVGGIFFGVITWFALARNGMMLGAFFHIFYRHDLSFEFWNTVLIHGMIELTMIVMAGGAGFMIARGLLFPGNLTLKDSLVKSGLGAVQLAVVIAMWLGLAAFQESFMTAYMDPDWLRVYSDSTGLTELLPFKLSDLFKVIINISSLGFMVFYFGALGTGQVKKRKSVSKVIWITELAFICMLLLFPFAVLILAPVVLMVLRDYRMGKLKKWDWILVGIAGLLAPVSLLTLAPVLVYILIMDRTKKNQKIYNLLRLAEQST